MAHKGRQGSPVQNDLLWAGWVHSSKPKVLSVSSTGVIKAAKKIKKNTLVKVTITAANGKSKVVNVYVVPKAKKLKKFNVKKVPKSLSVGDVSVINVANLTKGATGLKVTFKSSKSSVISVDKAGGLVAKKKGKALIKIKIGKLTVKTKKITVK
jgi:hypothetical protein